MERKKSAFSSIQEQLYSLSALQTLQIRRARVCNLMYRLSYRDNSSLVAALAAEGICSLRIADGMRMVDRKYFVGVENEDRAYCDMPLGIGGEQTISAPHMHAYALNYLEKKLKPGNRVLDVGCGSGIFCAYAAVLTDTMQNPQSVVCGVDRLPELVRSSSENVAKWNSKVPACKNFRLKVGDGWLGEKEMGPYDVIHVGAAACGLPVELMKQLKVEGLMVFPYDSRRGRQGLVVIERVSDSGEEDGAMTWEEAENQMEKYSSSKGAEFKLKIGGCGTYVGRFVIDVVFLPLVKPESLRKARTESH